MWTDSRRRPFARAVQSLGLQRMQWVSRITRQTLRCCWLGSVQFSWCGGGRGLRNEESWEDAHQILHEPAGIGVIKLCHGAELGGWAVGFASGVEPAPRGCSRRIAADCTRTLIQHSTCMHVQSSPRQSAPLHLLTRLSGAVPGCSFCLPWQQRAAHVHVVSLHGALRTASPHASHPLLRVETQTPNDLPHIALRKALTQRAGHAPEPPPNSLKALSAPTHHPPTRACPAPRLQAPLLRPPPALLPAPSAPPTTPQRHQPQAQNPCSRGGL